MLLTIQIYLFLIKNYFEFMKFNSEKFIYIKIQSVNFKQYLKELFQIFTITH